MAGLPTPLTGSEYQRVLKQYYNEPNDDFENHNFDKYGAMLLRYCKMGLPEACGGYGAGLAIGLYDTRDISKAQKYIEYAINYTKYESFKLLTNMI